MTTEHYKSEKIEFLHGRPLLPETVHSGGGFLTDAQIRAAFKLGMLLKNTVPDNAKYASYELRIGQKTVMLVSDKGIAQEKMYEETTKTYNANDTITIHPGQTIKLFAEEWLDIPANVLALALPVGNLYRLGLSPETTFADPGFTGEFWIVVCNYSGRVVDIKVGEPLARIQFIRLSSNPEKIHQGSGHVRVPPSFPRRVERPDIGNISGGDDQKISELLSRITDEVDPPHYEHTFITGVIRKYSWGRIKSLETSVKRLRRFSIMLGILIVVCFLIIMRRSFPWIWYQLPEVFRNSLREEIVKWIIGGIIVILTFVAFVLRNWLKKKVWTPFLQFFGLSDIKL